MMTYAISLFSSLPQLLPTPALPDDASSFRERRHNNTLVILREKSIECFFDERNAFLKLKTGLDWRKAFSIRIREKKNEMKSDEVVDLTEDTGGLSEESPSLPSQSISRPAVAVPSSFPPLPTINYLPPRPLPPPTSTPSYSIYPSSITRPPVQYPMQYINQNNPLSAYNRNIQTHQMNTNNSLLPRPTPIFKQEEPWIQIIFTLINLEEFTARANGSPKISLEILDILRRCPGVKFDWAKQRWVFPLASHETLLVALTRRRCEVESIPRNVLIAAQLASQHQKKTLSTMKKKVITIDIDQPFPVEEEEEEEKEYYGIQLSQFLPPTILSQLAPFQQEGVAFILSRQGRALLADEMGLGKTRMAIATCLAYKAELPALVVCPSSAKHHWRAEIMEMTRDLQLVDTPNPVAGSEQTDNNDNDNDVDSENATSEEEDSQVVLVLDSAQSCHNHREELLAALNGTSSSSSGKLSQIKFVIVSYSLLTKLCEVLQPSYEGLKDNPATFLSENSENLAEGLRFFNIVIIDESHYIKSHRAQRTRLLLPLLHRAKHAVLLSGTPALSRPRELFTQLNALSPKQWTDFKTFGKRYCVDQEKSSKGALGGTKKGWGGEDAGFKGAAHLQELHLLLTATVMLRRQKMVILQQMPPKRRLLENVTVENEEERQVLQGLCNTLLSNQERLRNKKREKGRRRRKRKLKAEDNQDGDNDVKQGEIEEEEDDDLGATKKLQVEEKAILMELFNRSGMAKLPAIIRRLDSFLADDLAGKVLVFAHHVDVLRGIAAHLLSREVDYVYIDGSVSAAERHHRAVAFQKQASKRVAVLGITAAGMALTLTAASTVFFAELYWTPAALLQAEDRAHRIGQLKEVTIIYFLSQGTIDDHLWPLLRKKMQVLGEFVEGQDNADIVATSSSSRCLKAKDSESSLPSEKSSQMKDDQMKVQGEFEKGSEKNLDESEDPQEENDNHMEFNELSKLAQQLAKEDKAQEGPDEEQEEDEEEERAEQLSNEKLGNDNDDDNERGGNQNDDYEKNIQKPQPPDALAVAYIRAYRKYMERQELLALQKRRMEEDRKASLQTFAEAVHIDIDEDGNKSVLPASEVRNSHDEGGSVSTTTVAQTSRCWNNNLSSNSHENVERAVGEEKKEAEKNEPVVIDLLSDDGD